MLFFCESFSPLNAAIHGCIYVKQSRYLSLQIVILFSQRL